MRPAREKINLLGGESELGSRAGLGEDNKLALEEDVTEDGEANTGVGLDSTVALGAGDGSVVDVGAGDGELGAADDGGEAGKSGATAEDVSTLAAGVRSAADLFVVGLDDGVGEEEKSGTLQVNISFLFVLSI